MAALALSMAGCGSPSNGSGGSGQGGADQGGGDQGGSGDVGGAASGDGPTDLPGEAASPGPDANPYAGEPGGDGSECAGAATPEMSIPWVSQKGPANSWKGNMCCGPAVATMAKAYASGQDAISNADLEATIDWMDANVSGWTKHAYQCDPKGTNTSILAQVLTDYAGMQAEVTKDMPWCTLVASLDPDHVVMFVGDSQGSNLSTTFKPGASHWLILDQVKDGFAYVEDPGRTGSSQGHHRKFTADSVADRFNAHHGVAVVAAKQKGCTNQCSSGQHQCSGGGSQACEVGPDGCRVWGAPQSCPSGCDAASGVCSGTACNNGVKEPGEQCDGAQLGGASCATVGFTAGTLACSASCTFDTSQCCKDECPSAGVKMCNGNQQSTCLSAGACKAWVPTANCPLGCDASSECKADPCANVTCTPGACQFGGMCVGGMCQYQNKPPGSSCDDGNPATQNDACNGAGVCGGCKTSYGADWVCEQYNAGSGAGGEIFNICTKVDAAGLVTIKATKVGGGTFGNRPYQVEVSSPQDGPCGPSDWFFTDVAASAQGIGTSTLTFSFTPSWLAGQTQKAYCVSASTQPGDPGYSAGDQQQKSWWYSKKVVVTKSCQ